MVKLVSVPRQVLEGVSDRSKGIERNILYPTRNSERYNVSIEAVTNQSRNEQVTRDCSHEPQEPVISRNTANKRGLRFQGIEPPSSRPPHIDHLFDECPLT
jgi:hypothetical protein